MARHSYMSRLESEQSRQLSSPVKTTNPGMMNTRINSTLILSKPQSLKKQETSITVVQSKIGSDQTNPINESFDKPKDPPKKQIQFEKNFTPLPWPTNIGAA